jgi:glycosyltransferase involved in cell wall biosynthesis
MSRKTKPARILLLTSSPMEGCEGADTQLAAAIADGVSDAVFTWFTLWPPRGAPKLTHGRHVPILSRDGMPHRSERAQIVLAAGALSRTVDLVHAVLTVGSGFPLLSRLARSLFGGRPVIHTVPGVMDPRLLGTARPIGVTVAASEATAELLRASGFGDVRVVPPAISLDRWPLRPRTSGPPMVLFAGHHDVGAGAVEAVTAAAAAARAGAEFRLVLAMRARPGEDASSRAAELRAQAHQAGIRDVEIYGHGDDMPALVAAADVVLFTPRTLAGKADVPLVVLEALATGRPVIMSDLPQFAAVSDAVLTAPIGDATRAGHLLAELLVSPRRWEALAARGGDAVRARFGTDQLTQSYARLYRELLAGPGAPTPQTSAWIRTVPM